MSVHHLVAFKGALRLSALLGAPVAAIASGMELWLAVAITCWAYILMPQIPAPRRIESRSQKDGGR